MYNIYNYLQIISTQLLRVHPAQVRGRAQAGARARASQGEVFCHGHYAFRKCSVESCKQLQLQ